MSAQSIGVSGLLRRYASPGARRLLLSLDATVIWADVPEAEDETEYFIEIEEEIFRVRRSGSCNRANVLAVEGGQCGTKLAGHHAGTRVDQIRPETI